MRRPKQEALKQQAEPDSSHQQVRETLPPPNPGKDTTTRLSVYV
jgi:hypothetical protein